MGVGFSAVSARNAATLYADRITSCEALVIRRFSDFRRHGWLTALLVAVSRLGDGPLWWTVGAVLLVFGGARERRAAFVAAAAVGTAVALFAVVKRRIGRRRPFEVWGDLPCLLAPPDRFSFPSGHTMSAFAAWFVLSRMIPGSGVLFLPAAVLIGVSRIFLGVHYPTDVLAGALIGSGLGALAVRLSALVFP